jgi:integrase
VRKERSGRDVENSFTRHFVTPWVARPLVDITAADITVIVKAKKRDGAPAMAGAMLLNAKRFFQWCVDEELLPASPVGHLKATKLIGDDAAGKRRDRTLNDAELRAFWRATERLGGPHGAAYKMLLLTGLRLNEVVEASWPEFVLEKRLWTIPKERMKGRDTGRGQARAHVVPLSTDVLAILEKLPRFARGKFLFSVNHGQSAVWMPQKLKRKLDALMLDELRREDPDAELPPWTNHDIRRTARSCWSRLRIGDEETREALLAHIRPGIVGTYDLYDRLDEKARALEAWAVALRGIVEPPTAGENVVQLHAR